ncbi:MAG TPA: hypothetical protein VMT69_08345 [Kineosporiaceae bacterium]|nr:hypothetical protein [Kineosporiaceae bacterium]
MTTRRIVCTLALPLLPLVLLAATLVSPTDSTDNATQLRAAAAHPVPWAAAAFLELLAVVVMALAVAAVVLAVHDRGVRVANIGGLLGVLGTVGMAAIAFRHVFISGLATIDVSQALRALDSVDATFGPVALPLMFLGPVALVVLSASAVRAGLAPVWIPFGAVVFLVVDMLPIPDAEVVQMAIGIVTFGVLARGLLTRAPLGGQAVSLPPAVVVAD